MRSNKVGTVLKFGNEVTSKVSKVVSQKLATAEYTVGNLFNLNVSNCKDTFPFCLLYFVMFKSRAAVFYRDFRPDKTRTASFLNSFKNIPGKACVKRVHNNDAFVNVGN